MFHRSKRTEKSEEISREEVEAVKRELKRLDELQKILEKEGHTTKTELALARLSALQWLGLQESRGLRSEFKFVAGLLVALLLFIAGLHFR